MIAVPCASVCCFAVVGDRARDELQLASVWRRWHLRSSNLLLKLIYRLFRIEIFSVLTNKIYIKYSTTFSDEYFVTIRLFLIFFIFYSIKLKGFLIFYYQKLKCPLVGMAMGKGRG